jgi:hypothetical protein
MEDPKRGILLLDPLIKKNLGINIGSHITQAEPEDTPQTNINGFHVE